MKKLTITIALMLVVALAMPAFGASFSDVPADHWAYNAINKLVAAGIVEGYPDGEYKGDESMTRYEMAVMVSRALDNIVDEMEAMGEGLTTGQAEDVTAIVKSLMEKNSQDELSNAQAEEVADIVDALTFELRSELKVLGADVDALSQDVAELEAKVDAMHVPEDKIEFGMEVATKAQVAYYGEDEIEERAVLELLQDGDAIDEDFTEDPDLFPAQERFWQEYNFNIAGTLYGGDFNLAVDTTTNAFFDERSVVGYQEDDSNVLEMDSALLQVAYEDTNVKIGDMPDYYPETYFFDEDFEGIEVMTNMYNIDFKMFAGGNDEDNDSTATVAGADEKIFGLTGSSEMEFGTLTGKVYHARNVEDGIVGSTTNPYENTLVALAWANDEITDALGMTGEVVFSDAETDNGNFDESGNLFNVTADYAISDIFNVNGMVEIAGEDFVAARNDLENENADYDLFKVGADYELNDNNMIKGHVMMVEPGDSYTTPNDDQMTYYVELNNTIDKFTNTAFVEYVENDGFEKETDYTLVGLGTEFAYNETMDMGAHLNYKTIEKSAGDFRDYVYLTGFVDKQLKENISWLTEVMVIDGTTDYTRDDDYYDGANVVRNGSITGSLSDATFIPDYGTGTRNDVDGTGYALTTSLSISF